MKINYYKSIDETLISETLDNGLEIYIIPKKGFSTKSAYFTTRFGGANRNDTILVDNKKVNLIGGLAHFLEHRVFDYKKGNVIDIYDKLGADCNAFTSYDFTTFYFSTTNDNFSECLDLLLDYPTSFTMKKEAVEKEKEIIVREALMTQDRSFDKMYTALMNNLDSTNQIAHPIVGTVDEINSTTIDMLRMVHSNMYSPDNMFLLVVGDVDYKEVIDQVKNFKFEKRKCNLIKKDFVFNSNVEKKSSEVITNSDVKKIWVGFKLKPISNLKGKDREKVYLCLDIISSILFNNSSKLNSKVLKKGLAAALGFSLFDYPNSLTLIVTLANIKDELEIYNLVTKTVKNALNLINEDKLERSKKKQIADIVGSCNEVSPLINTFFNHLVDSGNYLDNLDLIKSLTIEDLINVSKEYLLNADSSYVFTKEDKHD